MANRNTVVDDVEVDEYAMDTEAVERETKRGAQYWRPKDGENKVRILFLKGRGRYYLEAAQHFNVGPNNKSCFCTAEMLQKPCPVCREVQQLRGSDDPDDKVIAKDMKVKPQWFSAIVDLSAPDKGVQIWPYGIQIMKQLRNYALDTEYGNPFHPRLGRDFKVIKEKTGNDKTNVAYTAIAGPNPRPIANIEWMDEALEVIDGVIRFEEPETLKAWLRGEAFDGETNGDEALAPKATARTQRQAPAPDPDRPATEAQIKAIYAIGHQALGLDDDEIDEFCLARWNRVAEELTRREASACIDLMKLDEPEAAAPAAPVRSPRPSAPAARKATVNDDEEDEPLPFDDQATEPEPDDEDEEEEEEYEQEPVVPAAPVRATRPTPAQPAVSGKVPVSSSSRLASKLKDLQSRNVKRSA